MTHYSRHDVLIIGSGAAGLSLALRLAPKARIALIAKAALQEGATLYAQGGISVVLDKEDSILSHIEDTLDAGAGLCDRAVVEHTVTHARACIQWLVDQGVAFTREAAPGGGETYHLTREGGHSHRRVLHAADATGKAVETTLEAQARAHPNIEIFEHHLAIDLIRPRGEGERRCVGAYVLDLRAGHVRAFGAAHTVLATGGAGKVYLYTSNPDIASGDGIAMAWRAGCRVANMEFIQFHPTCLYHPNAKSFMPRFDPRAELAPRDIVARAIDFEMKRLGLECVYLDISHKPADFITSHFPNIYERCRALGHDMTREPIPVVPAAHYLCGGVMTDLRGRSDIPGLHAVGEIAHTGLHGANRMASNSLLECLVFAAAAAEDIAAQLGRYEAPAELPAWDESQVTDSDEEVVVAHNWDELRRFMWDYVGIVRTEKRLQRALHRTELLKQEIDEYYGNFRITRDLIELRNLVLVAELIIRSALSRKESRGLHYNLDYPGAADPAVATVLIPPAGR